MGLCNSMEWMMEDELSKKDLSLHKSNIKDLPVVIVKEQKLESERLASYTTKSSERKVLYEPETLPSYIGQEQAKAQILTAIKVIKKLGPIHILINGWAGCGKTTLARITANMLDANFIYRVPEDLKDIDELVKVINQIQNTERLTVFMLDEIHTINQYPGVANILLPVLQDFQYGDKKIRPFVMIGATTDKDQLVKKQAPLVSRFQIQITLDKYKSSEVKEILKNYKEAIYQEYSMPDKDCETISKNCRGVPRQAIALMKQYLVNQNIKQVLKENGIVKDGITLTDINILSSLAENTKPMGANYLSQVVDIPQRDYEEIYERFLVKAGYIARQARGRTITQKGIVFLDEIKGIVKGQKMENECARN